MSAFVYSKIPNAFVKDICKMHSDIFNLDENDDRFHKYEKAVFRIFVENYYLPEINDVLKTYLPLNELLKPLEYVDNLFEFTEARSLDDKHPDDLDKFVTFVNYNSEFMRYVRLINDLNRNKYRSAIKKQSGFVKEALGLPLCDHEGYADDAIDILAMFQAIELPADLPIRIAMVNLVMLFNGLTTDQLVNDFWLKPAAKANIPHYREKYAFAKDLLSKSIKSFAIN